MAEVKTNANKFGALGQDQMDGVLCVSSSCVT